jgi:hypothetical protein
MLCRLHADRGYGPHPHLIGLEINLQKHHLTGVLTLTFPSADPKMTSFGCWIGHSTAVTGALCGNLLQMDFLSPHSSPSLYTKTMLSLCAMARRVLSGEKAMPRTRKVLGPCEIVGKYRATRVVRLVYAPSFASRTEEDVKMVQCHRSA